MFKGNRCGEKKSLWSGNEDLLDGLEPRMDGAENADGIVLQRLRSFYVLFLPETWHLVDFH